MTRVFVMLAVAMLGCEGVATVGSGGDGPGIEADGGSDDRTRPDAGERAERDGGAGLDAGLEEPSPEPAPGGFIESASDVGDLGRLSAASIVAALPAAGERFTFPAPYGTEAVRLTDASSCGGGDCLRYVGYSYWRNINNHVGSEHLLLFLGLDEDDGGSGLTLLRVSKETLEVEDLGPVLAGTGLPTNVTGEGVYFSATMPHALYVHHGGRLLRVDVMTKDVEEVFDVRPTWGADHYVWQHHTSDDDRVHSFTLKDGSYASVGCAVYFADTSRFQLFASEGSFDECQVDRSGRWLVIKEDVDGADGEDNRVIQLVTGEERVLRDRDGAAGHSDLGYGYMIAADNWHSEPGAYRVWDFALPFEDPQNGVLAYHDTSWSGTAGDHVSHTNALAAVARERQVACNSRLYGTGATNPRSGEIVCYRLDGSLDVLVVAPTLSTREAAEDAYSAMPKGNLDVTGRWFVWTTNLGGDRLDAMLVRVPIELLVDG